MAKSIEISSEKQILQLKATTKTLAYSIKGMSGLKIYCFVSGGKVFKLRYKDLNGNYTTKAIHNWQQAVYGIQEAKQDAMQLLRELNQHKSLSRSSIKTFEELWNIYKKDISSSSTFKNIKKELQRFESNILSSIKTIKIDDINSPKIIRPLMLEKLKAIQTPDNPKTQTVKKVLNRLNQVFDFAEQKGIIQINPTKVLSQNFSKNFIIVKTQHAKAITDIAEFSTILKDVNEYWGDIYSKSCLKWTIMYALRSINARNARWQDIDLNKKVWHIGANDMKMQEDFTLPLTNNAISLLKSLPNFKERNGLVFKGANHAKPISDNTMRMILKRLGYKDDKQIDVHGFRSSFRTIMAELNYQEKLGFTEEILSLCIDHRLRQAIQSDKSYNRAKHEHAKKEVFEYWHNKLSQWGLIMGQS